MTAGDRGASPPDPPGYFWNKDEGAGFRAI